MGYIAVSRERLLAYLGQLAQTHKELIVLQRAINDIDCQCKKLGIPNEIKKPDVTNPKDDSNIILRFFGNLFVFLLNWVAVTIALIFFVPIGVIVFYIFFEWRLPILSDSPVGRFLATSLIVSAILAIPVAVLIAYIQSPDKKTRDNIWKEYERNVHNDQVRVYRENITKEKIVNYRNKLADQYARTSNMLNQLYEVKANGEYLLFPKYRNMVAIVMFIEYLESRRCSDLIGHEGAYNIYENEIRLNLIITQLNDVISRLDEIKDNQYYLYNLISDANRRNNQIYQELLSGISQISENTALAAAYSEATANNTAAMRMIEEYRFLSNRY